MRLGADVPALLRPGRVLMAGAGERVEGLRGDDAQALVVVPLDAALSTAAVYRAFDELGGGRTEDELAQLEATVRAGRTPPVNDLQRAALRLCPQIAPALEALAAAGAPDPLVSGSGPTIFGLVADAERAAARMRQAGYARAQAIAPVTEDFAAVRHNEQR
jgi:4-diphosphocytidyl-2-C-methyl-D-erythritol kinase